MKKAKKGIRAKKALRLRQLFDFLRANGKPGSEQGVSPFALATSALIECGRQMRDGESVRAFCEREAAFIAARARGAPPKASRPKRRELVVMDLPADIDPAEGAFLETFEWRRVRMMALKKYGPRCMCCGATPIDGAVMNVDHIKPRKLFPHLALDIDNLQILCGDCNHGKGNWDMTDWRPVEHQATAEEV